MTLIAILHGCHCEVKNMTLYEFFNVPAGHDISYEDGIELHKEIAKTGPKGLSDEDSERLLEYLEACLLHQSVSPDLVNTLQKICDRILNSNDGTHES